MIMPTSQNFLEVCKCAFRPLEKLSLIKILGTNFAKKRLIKLAKRENYESAWQFAKRKFLF